MSKDKITLSKKEAEILKFLVKFYEAGKIGCTSVEIIYSGARLKRLEEKGLVFKTRDGWFPSTEGQNYINN